MSKPMPETPTAIIASPQRAHCINSGDSILFSELGKLYPELGKLSPEFRSMQMFGVTFPSLDSPPCEPLGQVGRHKVLHASQVPSTDAFVVQETLGQ